jgi:predicted transcriptional regulator
MTKKTNTPTEATPKLVQSKREQLIKLLERDTGATLDEMITLTGWPPHTTRAALTGLRKKGHVITSDKVDGMRTYRAAPSETA